MLRRITYIIIIYLVLVVLMALQKPVFMLADMPADSAFSLAQYMQVMWHGLVLDTSMAAYLVAVPLLAICVSVFWVAMPVRAILAPWYAIVAIAISFTFIGDIALYSFWQFKLDASVLFYLQSPKNAMASVSSWYIVLRVVEALLYAAMIFALLMAATPRRFGKSTRPAATIVLLLLCIGIDVVAIRGGVGKSTTNIGKAYFSSNQFLNHSAVNPTFSFMYSLGKTEDFASMFRYYDSKESEEIATTIFGSGELADSIHAIAVERPNVLMIILEGIGANYTSTLSSASGITPHLDSIMNSSLCFTNCYGNSFRTDRGVVSALSGNLSYPTTSIMKMPAKSKSLPGIAATLARAGYDTEFIYGGDINFTNMQSYLRATGYDGIVCDTNFSLAERTTNAWGVNDDIVFDYLYRDIKQRSGTVPWFITMLSLSSHEPFVVPYDRIPDDKMANAAAYTDECLGSLISKLNADSTLWNNLLVVITADHGVYYPADEPRSYPKYFHIPLVITGGALALPVSMNESVIMQSDIAATLLAMLELPHDDFIFSRNVLAADYDRAQMAYYTFQNGFGMVDAAGEGIVYDTDRGETIYATCSDAVADSLVAAGKAILQYTYGDLAKR